MQLPATQPLPNASSHSASIEHSQTAFNIKLIFLINTQHNPFRLAPKGKALRCSVFTTWDFFPNAFLRSQVRQRKASLIFFCELLPATITVMLRALTWTWGGLKSMLYTLPLAGWTQRALRRSFSVSKGMFKLITRSSSQILSSASACPSVRGKPVQAPQQKGAVGRGRKAAVMGAKSTYPAVPELQNHCGSSL